MTIDSSRLTKLSIVVTEIVGGGWTLTTNLWQVGFGALSASALIELLPQNLKLTQQMQAALEVVQETMAHFPYE